MPTKNERLSRNDWLAHALDTLAREGVSALRIETLAKSLGVTRGSFYWHFRDRDELLQSLLTYWTDEFTTVVADDKKLDVEEDPEARLYQMMLMILENDLTKYDLAIRDWAAHDAAAAKAVEHVYQMRLEFVQAIFSEIGFRGQDLEMRTRLFVCYHSWEQAMFHNLTKDERRKLLRLRHQLLVAR